MSNKIRKPKKKNDDAIDWRIAWVDQLAKPLDGPIKEMQHKAGTKLTPANVIKFGHEHLLFSFPSMVALLLEYSFITFDESQKMLNNKRLFMKAKLVPPDIEPAIRFKSLNSAYKIVRLRMASVVFSYSAIERFANEIIPIDYKYEKEFKSGRTETLDKHGIERNVDLGTKLGVILPEVLDVESPKGKQEWEKYKSIKKLRDRIIHMKSIDAIHASGKSNTIWEDLLSKNLSNFALDAKAIIGYFISDAPEKKKPRWFVKFPYS